VEEEEEAYDAISFTFSDTQQRDIGKSKSHGNGRSEEVPSPVGKDREGSSSTTSSSTSKSDPVAPTGLSKKPRSNPSAAQSVLLDIDLGDGNKGAINVTATSNAIVSEL
jgi:hypothetical protein